MKKILVLATSAFLISGVALAQDKTKEKPKAKCEMACCKGKDGKCGKDAKCSKEKEEKKETKTTTQKKA